jgi:hypothetical protein
MTNVNSTDFLRVVDHAAAMNDRWLFLAAFCLLLLGCGVVIYWLVKQLQAVLAGHKAARDAHQVALTQIKSRSRRSSPRKTRPPSSSPSASTATPPQWKNARWSCGGFGNGIDAIPTDFLLTISDTKVTPRCELATSLKKRDVQMIQCLRANEKHHAWARISNQGSTPAARTIFLLGI